MILEQFKNRNQFNESELYVIDYIIKNTDCIETMTLSELSIKTLPSNTSILRLCKKLGFRGFSDFKIQLIKDLSRPFVVDYDVNIPFLSDDSVEALCNKLAQITTEGIVQTQKMLNPALLEKAIDVIQNSPRIFLFGKGDSFLCAQNFRNKLLLLNRYCILADEFNRSAYSVGNMQKGDCAIFFSYGIHHYDYTLYASTFKKRGVHSIIITGNTNSELSQFCDIVLPIPNSENSVQKIGNFFSQSNMEFISNILYSLIFQRDYMNNYKNKHTKDRYTEHMLSNK